MSCKRDQLFKMNCADCIDDYLYVDYQPVRSDAPAFIVRWQDDEDHEGNAISSRLAANLLPYTGFVAPEPLSRWQRGGFGQRIPGRQGPIPAFQWYCREAGILMNSWYSTYRKIRGGGQNTVFSISFSQPIRPWLDEDMQLHMEGEVQIPYFERWHSDNCENEPVGQFSYMAYFKDRSSQKTIAIVINAFDNRPHPPEETVMHDTFVSFASTRFGASRYVTPAEGSAAWGSSTWSGFRPFKVIITRRNFNAVVSDINARHNAGLSAELSDYLLSSAGILQETFRDKNDHVALGASFANFEVYLGVKS